MTVAPARDNALDIPPAPKGASPASATHTSCLFLEDGLGARDLRLPPGWPTP